MTVETAEVITSESSCPALAAGVPSQLTSINSTRRSLSIENDSAAPATVYLLLGVGVPSPTNFHFALPAGVCWNGVVGTCVWQGPVQGVCSANTRVGVVAV